MAKKLSEFEQKLSPFLKEKLDDLKRSSGEDSPAYRGLALQYLKDDRETKKASEANLKHYEAQVTFPQETANALNIERLYRRCMVIETTFVCAAHCRYCLRSNYPRHTMTEAELVEVAQYAGTGERRERLNEVLITGGDPMLTPKRLNFLVEALMKHAPNIKTFRVGSRLMGQAPEKVDDAVFSILRNKKGVRFEVGTQINHPVEFFPEVCEAFIKLKESGVKIYAQNVLLKGVNDDIETLVNLYDLMRQYDIEAHYLFHCVPMIGIHHLRPSVEKGIQLTRALVSSGRISGRAKPMFAAMTDIGKITFYDGVICSKQDGRLLLQSNYLVRERADYNPGWQLPNSAEVDKNGFMQVWYLDGED